MLLGASLQLVEMSITASLPGNKRRGYIVALRGIRARISLTPVAAAKVRGKLGFAQSLPLGHFGRAVLREFSARQYTKSTGPRFPPTDEMKETIQWWASWLRVAKPRTVSLHPATGSGVYRCGGLGAYRSSAF